MALSGSQKAYLQARAGIARSAAIRSNYVFPLFGLITAGGSDITRYIEYGSMRVTLALNEQPDTASFNVELRDAQVQADVTVGLDVVISLAGSPLPLFGGRILTTQTTKRGGTVNTIRSVVCADYLQVLDSEYLVTYDWPAQSATVTILDLIARFANRAHGLAISTAAVAAGLPSHAAIGFINEKFSTVLRRLVTMFPTGGGFYVDALKILHVWQGASEPNQTNPTPITLANPLVKAFAETEDGSQVRDACLVEGVRTTAPIGSPPPDPTDPAGRQIVSMPVVDASILDPITDTGTPREVRINTQRAVFSKVTGIWSGPANQPVTTYVTNDVPFTPTAGGDPVIGIADASILFGRPVPQAWIVINGQYLYVKDGIGTQFLTVPRTGYGSQKGPIKANDVVTVSDSLALGTVTGRYDAPGNLEKIRPQAIGADVVMTVRSASGNAIQEQLVQDGRYNRTGATNRGTQEIRDFRQPLVSITFETEDLNAAPGRVQVYDIADGAIDPLRGQYMIITADLTWPVWGLPPRRVCFATDVQHADVTDTWLVDTR